MKSLALKFVTALAVLGLAFSTLSADAAKGQRYYLKTMKKFTGYNGTKFAAQHTQSEWTALFDNDAAGFVKEFTEKHPDLKKFFEGKAWPKVKDHIKDFAIKYASDSGNVPSC